MTSWPLFVRAAAVAGFLALAFVLISSAAHASACHIYTHWYYPWPQRCLIARAPEPRRLAASTDHYAMPHRPATLNPIDRLRAAMVVK